MRYAIGAALLVALVVVFGQGGLTATRKSSGRKTPTSKLPPYVRASTPIKAGEYLIRVGGCNDCHTPNWADTDGKVDSSLWLTGKAVGDRGAWGTTYPANLRLVVQEKTEDDWVAAIRKPDPKRPPMPWMNITPATERDLRAMYRFIKSLGAKGDKVPAFVPPDKEPKTPYMMFVIHEPKTD